MGIASQRLVAEAVIPLNFLTKSFPDFLVFETNDLECLRNKLIILS